MDKNITAIKSILDFAFERTGLFPDKVMATWRNPCTRFVGSRKKDKPESERKPFTPEHVAAIFDLDRYATSVRIHPARFWLPLLLHYTGAAHGDHTGHAGRSSE